MLILIGIPFSFHVFGIPKKFRKLFWHFFQTSFEHVLKDIGVTWNVL